MYKIIFLFVSFSISVHSECVHERTLSGMQLLEGLNSKEANLVVKDVNDKYVNLENLSNINPASNYNVQVVAASSNDSINNNIKYYDYEQLLSYLDSVTKSLAINNLSLKHIGDSVLGRKLMSILPTKFDPSKKTILMFGRHHGDEGTANWIIEGFLNSFLASQDAMERFQLILYPMINPDGANGRTRFNANSRDLNRVWYKKARRSKDEIKTIQSHLLKNLLDKGIRPAVTLDMHGSFTNDFIYRVSKRFVDRDFYQLQQDFIDQLSSFDPWQAGAFYDSDGDSKMARIYLVRDFSLNALTHETKKEISLLSGRSIESLKEQGESLLTSILKLY